MARTCSLRSQLNTNLKNSELISLYDSIQFILECFHDQEDSQWHKKALRKYPTKQQQNGQSIFLPLSSDGLAQYCVNLSCWFMHEMAAFSTEQCTTPSLFHNFEASQGARSHTHLNTTASNLGRHFLYLYLRMRT